VGNRVFAQIAAFMGNTELRGKVIWFLLTCRPDYLPVDLKRQGRAEEHIALFYPDTEAERAALVQAMLKKSGTTLSPEAARCFVERSVGLSGADIEAVLTRARMLCALGTAPAIGPDDVKAVLDDFVPPSYPTEIELQNLVAVLECTSRKLLPQKYRDADRTEIVRRVNELEALTRG
jgi:SpoVK/Ycf46/Vps4 family AAA+-type ATPase